MIEASGGANHEHAESKYPQRRRQESDPAATVMHWLTSQRGLYDHTVFAVHRDPDAQLELRVFDEDHVRELGRKVDDAAQASTTVVYTPDRKGIVSRIEANKKERRQFKDLPPDAEISFESGPLDPWQVTVENPEYYPPLMMFGYMKVLEANNHLSVDDETIFLLGNVVKRGVEHEFDHAVPAIEDPNLEVDYGVSFTRNDEDLLAVQGFVRLNGTTTYDMYKKIVGGPAELSHSDKASLIDDEEK